jgi:NAD(P)H-nitrite reductase large subunit
LQVEEQNIKTICSGMTDHFYGQDGDDGRLGGMLLQDGTRVEAQIVIVCTGVHPGLAHPRRWLVYMDQPTPAAARAGVRPRDELARGCGLEVGERGGVVVDDGLRTSDPDIFAVGEVACHNGFCYGLVNPGKR